jgi:DNA polymerase-3 subunit alpha
MDFHGSLELMLFEDKLKELEEDFDLSEPIAFKVRAKVNDFGTQLSFRKMITLKDAKKEKLKTKKVEKIESTLNIAIDYSDDAKIYEPILSKIHEIVRDNQGKRQMMITIKADPKNIEIDSGYYVNKSVENMLKKIDGVCIG